MQAVTVKMDCKVLVDGYEVFRGWMLEHTKLDVDNSITIQSMASKLMLLTGCYGNVYQISGVLQQFVARCVVGGRVMTYSDKKYHVKREIADFGACSLYPSAMYYMDWFLENKPKVLNYKSYGSFKKQYGYFIRIKL